jgi:hypothetical protein
MPLRLAFALIALLLIAACSPPPELRDVTLLQDESILTAVPTAQPTIEATPTVIGAQPSDTENATAMPTVEATEEVLIADGLCAAPCWRGITPGVTAWRDALTILEDDPTLQNVEIQSSEDSAAAGAQFQNVGGQRPCCQLFSSSGEIVDAIILTVAPTVTIGEVIEVWGEPRYALGSPYADGQSILNVVYPDVPMVITVFVAGDTAAVSASSEVISIWYMTDADMELLINTNSLHFWEGYDAFSAYDEEEGTFDSTPSITLTPAQ